MKVKDLIKELKKCPPTAEVVVWDNKEHNTCVEIYNVQEGHFNGEYMLDEDDWRELNEDPDGKYPNNAVRLN